MHMVITTVYQQMYIVNSVDSEFCNGEISLLFTEGAEWQILNTLNFYFYKYTTSAIEQELFYSDAHVKIFPKDYLSTVLSR